MCMGIGMGMSMCMGERGLVGRRKTQCVRFLTPPATSVSPTLAPSPTGHYTALAEHHVCSRRPAAAAACKKAVFRLYNGAAAALAAHSDGGGGGEGAAAAWDEANWLLHR